MKCALGVEGFEVAADELGVGVVVAEEVLEDAEGTLVVLPRPCQVPLLLALLRQLAAAVASVLWPAHWCPPGVSRYDPASVSRRASSSASSRETPWRPSAR